MDIEAVVETIKEEAGKIKNVDRLIEFIEYKIKELGLQLEEEDNKFRKSLGSDSPPAFPEDIVEDLEDLRIVIKKVQLFIDHEKLNQNPKDEGEDKKQVIIEESKVFGSRTKAPVESGPTQKKDYLSMPEVSAMIGCPESTIYKMTSNHSIPYSKVGRRLVFKRADIEKWIDKKKKKPIE